MFHKNKKKEHSKTSTDIDYSSSYNLLSALPESKDTPLPTPRAPVVVVPWHPACDLNVVWEAISQGNDSFIRANVNADNVNKLLHPDKQYSLLHHAVKLGKVEIVKYLLSIKADVNAVDSDLHDTPLHTAVRMGTEASTACIEPLIAAGAYINATNNGYSPLMLAIVCANENAIKLLLTHHADVNLWNYQAETALSLLISQRGLNIAWEIRIAQLLIQHGAYVGPEIKVRATDYKGVRQPFGNHMTLIDLALENIKHHLVGLLHKAARAQATVGLAAIEERLKGLEIQLQALNDKSDKRTEIEVRKELGSCGASYSRPS